MRILLFGTGEYYNRYKIWFEQEEVLALIDNSKDKVGTYIDEKMIISPSQVREYDFDEIFIMSFYIIEMKKQLVDLGVEVRKIHHFYDIHDLIYNDSLRKEVRFYNTNIEDYKREVLLLNQDLTLGGPALALFQVAKTLRKNGYDVTYASQFDGPLREILVQEGYKVVVDVNLLVQTMNECEWIKDYSLIICNTINFHVFLSERNTSIPMIWWLHDALFFYDGVNKKAINSISSENLKICAVGPVSENAIKTYRPDFVVEDLLYGVDDEIETTKLRVKEDDVIKFVTIGYIESRKGQDVLVKAIKLLPEEVRRKTKYSLIGKKTSMLAQEIIAECEDVDEIEFTGIVDRKQINSILNECDVMICPSREDPMPTVCAEAMMHSVPCIVSDAAGIVKYITNKVDGIVFKSENPDDLAEKIIWIVKNHEMISKMGKAARELYENFFEMKVFEYNLMRIINGDGAILKKIVIYGAQAVALGAYRAMKTVFPDRNIECFLVTSMENNAPILGGIPVRELQEFVSGMTQEEKDDIEVLIGTPENVMTAIEAGLEGVGLHNYVRLTSIRWADMQRDAFLKNGEYIPLSAYPVGCHKADLEVYKMLHYKDKALSTVWTDPSYIKNLQVGGALTDEKIAELNDALGDNISEKNGNYSELTGLYWIWKNALPKLEGGSYCGLAHYRRMLELSEDDLLRLVDNDIDVVLPYPMPYEPSIEAHHLRYLSDSEWNAVLQALEELQPDYAEAFKNILKQGYFYNYNVILAKKDVLDDYCSWLFSLLFRIEEINDPKGEKQPNRYIGYVGESLETLYFMYNKDKLKITHAGCRFLT